MTRIATLLAAALIGSSLVAGPAIAQGTGVGDFSAYDDDADGAVTRAEFYEGFDDTAYFADADADSDGFLSSGEIEDSDEFKVANYDSNGNGVLSRGEYYDGVFDAADADGSGFITAAEFEPIGDILADLR